MNNHTKEITRSILMWFIIFGFCMIFFNRFHSLVILDTDDWNYLNFFRGLFPNISEFNPIKVFPENFFPAVSKISYRVFYKITGSFITSLACGYNIVISCFIAMYVWLVYKVFSRKYRVGYSVLLAGLFFVLHFLIYRNGILPNQYGFYSITVNNYFNYTIPTLLNYIIVFGVIVNNRLVVLKKNNIVQNILFLILSYFAIFSNLFSNEVLPIWLAVDMFFDIIQKIRKKEITIGAVVKDNIIKSIVIIMWFISMYFELHGARSGQLTSNQSFRESLKITIDTLKTSDINKWLLLGFLALTIICTILCMVNKHVIFLLKINTVWIVILVYCILLSAKVNTWYISRADVQLEFMGMLLFSVVVSLGYLLNHFMARKGIILLMICCLVSIVFVNTGGKTYRDSNIIALSHTNGDFDAYKVEKLDNYIIDQIIDASENKQSSIELRVPFFYTEDNWPIANYGVNRIPIQLYEYGVIKNPVNASLYPDETLNYLWEYK